VQAPFEVPTKEQALPSGISGEEVLAIWSDDWTAEGFPQLIVVGDDYVQDFLAWVTTFFASFRPFTSFFQVIPWSLYKRANLNRTTSSSRMRGGIIGAIFGEILAEAKSLDQLEHAGLQVFGSTFSFAMARAIHIYEPDRIIVDYLLGRWENARKRSNQKNREIYAGALSVAWNCLAHIDSEEVEWLSETSQIVHKACREIRLNGLISAESWLSIAPIIPYELVRHMDDSSRENQLHLFDEAVPRIAKSKGPSMLKTFAYGWLLSLLGNDLGYSELIVNLDKDAMLWYGICVGLRAGEHLVSLGDGSERRILREIERPFTLLSRPNSDISIDEFEVLLHENQEPSFPRATNSLLNIELMPGVSTTVQFPPKKDAAVSPVKSALFEPHVDLALRSLATLKELFNDEVEHIELLLSPERGDYTPESMKKIRKRK
jgi:hypothetical protein